MIDCKTAILETGKYLPIPIFFFFFFFFFYYQTDYFPKIMSTLECEAGIGNSYPCLKESVLPYSMNREPCPICENMISYLQIWTTFRFILKRGKLGKDLLACFLDFFFYGANLKGLCFFFLS